MKVILTSLAGDSCEISSIRSFDTLNQQLFEKFPNTFCSLLYEDKIIIDKNEVVDEKIFRKLCREELVTFTIIRSPMLLVDFLLYTIRNNDLMREFSYSEYYSSDYIRYFKKVFELYHSINKDLFLLYNDKELNNVFRIKLYHKNINKKKRDKIR